MSEGSRVMSTVSAWKTTGAKAKSRRESEIGQSVKLSSSSSVATSETAGTGTTREEERTARSNLRVAEIARRLASAARRAAEAARRAAAPAASTAILGATTRRRATAAWHSQ